MKCLAVLAACMVAANAATQSGLLANGGTGKCIVLDQYDEDADTFSLTIGSCSSKDAVRFTYKGKDKPLRSSNGYCLGSLDGDSEAGAELILAECDSSFDDQKWTRVKSGNKFENNFGLCLDYDSGSKYLVQNECQDPMPGSMQSWAFVSKKPSPTTTVNPAPTDSGSQTIACTAWANQWQCPENTALNAQLSCIYPTSATNAICSQICCAASPVPPPPSGQLCGQWSVKNGGPVNACGAGYSYTAGNSKTCAANGSNCQELCCSPQLEQQSCGAFCVKFGGPTNCCPDNTQLIPDEYATCDINGRNCPTNCCAPLPQN